MYDKLNKLGMDLVKVANKLGTQALATEIYSFLPVEDQGDFGRFQAQLGVVRTLLKLRPMYTHRVYDSFNALAHEVAIVDSILRDEP